MPREASSSLGGCQSPAPPLLGSSLTQGSCFRPLPEFSQSGTPVGRTTEAVTPTALREPGSSSQPPLAWELRQVFQWGWGRRLQCEEGFAHGSEEMGVPCARDHLSKVTEAWRPRDGPPGERVGAKDGAPEKLDPVVRSSELTGRIT